MKSEGPYLDVNDDDPEFFPTPGDDKLITQKELLEYYLPFDRTTIWRMVKAGTFPQPVRTDSRLRWRLSDIKRWIANLSPVERKL